MKKSSQVILALILIAVLVIIVIVSTTKTTETVWLLSGNGCSSSEVPVNVAIDPSFDSEKDCLEFIQKCKENATYSLFCGVA